MSVLSICVFFSGCASFKTVVIKNETNGIVKNLHFKTSSGRFDYKYGDLWPRIGTTTTFHEMSVYKSDTCMITWGDTNGNKFQVTLNLVKEKQKPSIKNDLLEVKIISDGKVQIKSCDGYNYPPEK